MVKITKASASRSLCAMLSCSEMSDSLQSHGLQPARLLCLQGLSRQEYWSGLPYPPPGDLPGLNPGLPHCRRILYHLSHQGSPRILEWVVCPFSRGSSWPRNRTTVSCIAGGFFTSWVTREDPWSLQFTIIFNFNLFQVILLKLRKQGFCSCALN